MNRFCSIFSQLLKLFPRTEFSQLVRETRAHRHARGFDSWTHFVSMMFCQLGRAHSLREISNGLRSCEGKLNHLGVERAPARSTLAYANAHRPWQLFEKIFHQLFDRCRVASPPNGKKKFRFKNKLLSLDSTTMELCASLFDWARYTRAKGAVKLHLVLDHDGYLPSVAVIEGGRHHDVTVARTLRFEPGTILVMDRGYLDYGWYAELTAQGVFFVTRARSNMVYEVVEERPVPERGEIRSDQIVRLTGDQRGKPGCAYELRRVEAYVPEKDEVMVFLTNHLHLGSTTIARIYKDRWQIELFFKHLKQNLKIKSFVGTTVNAVQIQIWTALIAMLLLRYLQLHSRYSWSLSNLVALLRLNLFVHRDFWTWIDRPFEQPPELPQPVQAELTLA